MPEYKLVYFNARGWAELARLVMHYAGVEFEDFRFERDEWPQYKEKMPFKKVPILEVDGKVLAQSQSIARYLARKHGLAGKSDWEQAQADMYVDCMVDLMKGTTPAYMEQDPVKKQELMVSYINDVVIPHAQIIEKHLANNATGFLVGSQVTWADLSYFSWFSFLQNKMGHVLKLNDTPHLKKLIEHIGNVPSIKEWIEKRPKTEA
nr:glutathione S-transferase sigma [Diaphanosoma celebensis]QST14966.1 GSTsigma1g protein [Diaphanosoma celebensis]